MPSRFEIDDGLWAEIEPLIPVRPRRQRYPGRKPIADRLALNGILHVLHTGIAWEELRRRPDWVTRKHRTFSDRQRSTESLRQWIAWRDAHPEPWDWRDLWIRDQRMSGITAAIEQSLDLIDCASICAVNCAQLFDIMLAEPEAARRAKTLQMRVLELSGTGLASIPVNPVLDSALVRHGRKGKRYVANVADERGAS